MIAVDTCIWIAYLQGDESHYAQILESHFDDGQIYMPPPVMSEILSDPVLPSKYKSKIMQSIFMTPHEGYWERAGLMRAKLIKKKLKPRLPDTLIAQSCIDHGVPLLSSDKGFEKFQKHAGLKLAA